MRTALERLCGLCAPSGFEEPAAREAARLLEPLMDEVYTDRNGNVVGVRRCGREGAKRLLLDAHLDEIGLLVIGIEDGFLRFRTIGGVDPRMLPNREVTVLTDPPLYGVVACMPPHILKEEEQGKSIPISQLLVDVGMSQEQALRAVPVGTPMVFREGCAPLGEKLLCGKAMDDRACFVTLLRAAELLQDRDLDVDLYLMGSVAEEVPGSGAALAAYDIKPDFCVAVDVTHGRTPDAPKDRTFPLGSGAAIGTGPNMTRWMTRRLVEKAEEKKIPYRLEVMSGHSGTNGWGLQISREGVATAVVSLPLKYMHSPVETLCLEDMEHVAALLATFVQGLGEEAPEA